MNREWKRTGKRTRTQADGMGRPAVVLVLAVLVGGGFWAERARAAEPSLVPDTPSTAPDYFCTWNLQGFCCSYSNPDDQADMLTEANLFGKGPNQNWVEFYPEVRGDLYLVLDDTWDMPLGGGRGHPLRGSLELDTGRFPSYQGTPTQRLTKLNRDVQARGWRGLGLWILSCRAQARQDPQVNDEQYWTERFLWCQEAGIEYWKVDWGQFNELEMWRLNQWARQANPGVWIEHGGFKTDGSRLWFADKIGVCRTYDVNPSAAIPVTIGRVAGMLRHPRQDWTSAGLSNCEDEPYIGAALGCVYGVMRHPLQGNMPNGQPDKWFRKEARNLKYRLDEVIRAVRWHRIAHPFGVTDREIVDRNGFRDKPAAPPVPARIARGGLPLPTVTMPNDKEAPYVLCSRHPDGEIAIATIARKTPRGEIINPADVTLEIGELNRPIGIFGHYASLTFVTTSALAGKRILAQDLAGKTPVDITSEVKFADGKLTIPGAVIHRVGLMAAKPGDISEPGLVLAVEGLTKFIPKKPMTPHNFDAVPLRPLPVAKPGEPLRIDRAVWGSVYGGKDVTALVSGMVRDGELILHATAETLGDDTTDSDYLRLELDYTCNGKAGRVLAVFGNQLTIDAQGNYRTFRTNYKRPAPRESLEAQIPPDGLALWLTARDAVVEDGDVARIKDRSGHHNDAVREKDPLIAAGNPVVVKREAAGQPVLRFNGRFSGYEFKSVTNIRTAFMVVSKPVEALKKFPERFVLGGKTKEEVDFHVGWHWTDVISENWPAKKGKAWFNGFECNPTVSEFSPKLAVISLMANTDLVASQLARDRDFKDRSWWGDIAEVILYSRPLADADRTKVEEYLLKKYAITPVAPVVVPADSVKPGHVKPPAPK